MNQPILSRKLPLEPTDELNALTVMIMSLPFVVHKADALAVMSTGLGEPERVAQVLKDWQDPRFQARHCFITGQNPQEKFSTRQTVKSLSQEFGVTKHEGLIVQPSAEHTLHQAKWVREQIIATGATSLALYGPFYHIERAWSTFVQEIVFNKEQEEIWIPIVPVVVIVNPFDPMPEYLPEVVTKFDLIPGEFARSRTYTKKGDVASYADMVSYYQWLWEQPLLQG